MHMRQWAGFLGVPLWLQCARAGAAAPSNGEDHSYESDAAPQQEPLFGLCPDYTSYARHIQ